MSEQTHTAPFEDPVSFAADSEPRLQLTYAITPPNRTTSVERRQEIATVQSARIASLPIDALLVYDLQDESVRNDRPRPFPFVPKVDPLTYAFDELRVGDLPRVVYRAVAGQNEPSFLCWLDRMQGFRARAVFVGAPSHRARSSLTLPQAHSLCRSHAPTISFGGVVIAERHETSGSEDSRVWAKMRQGCQFFVSQTLWSVGATKRLLRDLRIRADMSHKAPPPILMTLSVCGSSQTLQMQEWLGVAIPPTVKRELLQAKDMLARSVELALDVFVEVRDFAMVQGLSIGCNVESVSTRVAEVDASMELVRRIDASLTLPMENRVIRVSS